MRTHLLSLAIISAFAVPLASLAQTSGDTAGKGGSQSAAPNPAAPAGSMEQRYGTSPRCDSMTGSDKEKCLRDEAQKTEDSQPDAKAPQGAAGSGSTSPSTPATSTETPASSSATEAAPSTKQ